MPAATPAFTDLPPQSPLRAAITAAFRRPEAECVAALLARHPMSAAEAEAAGRLARRLVTALRARPHRGAADGLIREYDLSSQEGVALMCLAEALLRIPDPATRDALIRDKIALGDWRAHVGQSPSVFVNAATWGLVVTGKLVGTGSEAGLGAALTRLIGRGGEGAIRAGVDLAMRMLGEQFVSGETIEAALARARRTEARGFRHSYDMLGEAATTMEDAERYMRSYENAIHAIGAAAAGRGLIQGPGISVKLSALHPRYTRSQRARVMAELLPRLHALCRLARRYDIGLNIDAEETDRLDLSLDLLEALCRDPSLAGWNGIGFVVQAYQKRAPFVLDEVIALARGSGHRLMLRLVKGAYWDAEIKRAQQDGLAGFPVFTRKLHTDISYLACARLLLSAPDAVFPQFATHNAQTLAAIYTMAGPDFHPGQYEFQCLHGMGEPLYDEVVGPDRLDRPCRIYAPVGTHETLLAYLVRRLLENGANTSFVNRIAQPGVSIEALIANPLADASAGPPHPRIALPAAVVPGRASAAGLDLASEAVLADLGERLRHLPALPAAGAPVTNPADRTDIVGHVAPAGPAGLDAALAALRPWPDVAVRAPVLRAAAGLLEARMADLLGLIIREAGKTVANAIGEVREAVDFLRYYAAEAEADLAGATPLGIVACISPWNFPLSIFTGQVAAALAAGNAVAAKPAEQTPLIAAAMVALLHEAGVPETALQLVQGAGEAGAALVADPRVGGVVFTGSTEVARLIQATLARRLGPTGHPVPLVAETGGQNAMVVDSSALAEQVVADVLTSAFDSAGQRCSALRVLCLQDDVAGRILTMLKGAMAELAVGDPRAFATDVGPVITADAAAAIEAHVARMQALGCAVHRTPVPAGGAGSFAAPTLIEIADIGQLTGEVFGPVLHVLRWRRERLGELLGALASTGYALTFGVHSRIDETIERAVAAAPAGNIYVNRSLIGAVVGVQPFGGHGLSGTGPKAGGPLYLRRLVAAAPALPPPVLGGEVLLPGPVGERNAYSVEPRGTVLCVAASPEALAEQERAARATGNKVSHDPEAPCDVVLFDGAPEALMALAQRLAARPGPLIPIHCRDADGWRLEALVRERAVATNTTAAGGNATLMTIG